MNKPELHYIWVKIRAVKVSYLLVPFLASTVTAVYTLRANNLGMLQRRDAVYVADKENKDIEAKLQDLRGYVYAHMNTKLASSDGVYPPIQLKYTYERLKKAEADRVAADNAQIYPAAQKECEAENPTGFSGRGRIPCIEAYVSSHGEKARSIPDAKYKFDFVSATWSPDLAGFSVLASFVFGVLLVLRILAGRILSKLSR